MQAGERATACSLSPALFKCERPELTPLAPRLQCNRPASPVVISAASALRGYAGNAAGRAAGEQRGAGPRTGRPMQQVFETRSTRTRSTVQVVVQLLPAMTR